MSATSRRSCVLIAHDDPGLRAQIAAILSANDYAVELASQDQTLQDSMQNGKVDLVVLGGKARDHAQVIEKCRRLRERSLSGIVLVSGGKVENGAGDHRADGLEAGADDYITATIGSREFLARIRAVLRRTRGSEPARRFLTVDDLELDREHRYLRRKGKRIHLTRREFDLLSMMMQKPGTPFTHLQLLRSVWGPDYGSELEYLRAYIRLLRKKIDVDVSKPSFIRTVPGVGYCFQDSCDL